MPYFDKSGLLTLENTVHPYLNNTDETKTITIGGATSIVVKFNMLSATEAGHDFVYVLDGSDNIIATWSGSTPPSDPIEVPGDTVKIRLTSDTWANAYGYKAEVALDVASLRAWTLTASGDAAHLPHLIDDIDYNYGQWFEHNYWADNSSPPWVAVDMGSAQSMDFVRWQTDTRWGQNPWKVTLYTSDNGVDWTERATALWPSGTEDQFIYLGIPVTARHFKLEFTGLRAGWAHGDEIWAGLRASGETYKVYWKTYPRQCLGFYVPPLDPGDPTSVHYPSVPVSALGEIDSLSCSTVSAETAIRIWRTRSLGWFPETVFWDWYAPENLGSLTIESKTLIAVYNHVNASTLGTQVSFQISESVVSIQSYFDFLYAWWISGAAGDYVAMNDVTTLTAEELVTMYSHLFHWHSLNQDSPDHDVDVARLTVSDHYLLLVYSAVYAPVPPQSESFTAALRFGGLLPGFVPPNGGGGGGGGAGPTGGMLVPIECFHLLVDNPVDQRAVTLDWSRWLGAGDAILTAAWTADVGVIVSSTSSSDTTATAAFSTPAAVSGETYLLHCTITTQTGRTEVRTVQLDIRESDGTAHDPNIWWRM